MGSGTSFELLIPVLAGILYRYRYMIVHVPFKKPRGIDYITLPVLFFVIKNTGTRNCTRIYTGNVSSSGVISGPPESDSKYL